MFWEESSPLKSTSMVKVFLGGRPDQLKNWTVPKRTISSTADIKELILILRLDGVNTCIHVSKMLNEK